MSARHRRAAYADRLEANVGEQRRQLAWAAKHLDDYAEDGLMSTDLHELRIALLKALAATLEAEQIAGELTVADEDDARAARCSAQRASEVVS